MAAGNSRELCSVCLERFDHDDRHPVALSCGHSFCRPCLTSEWSLHSRVQCPNCSRIHEGEHPRDLPINYLLLSVIERVTDNREEPSVSDEHREEEEEEPKKREYCKDSDSSDSDSEEEDCKGIKKSELIEGAKSDEKDKKRNDEAEDPILRSPIEDEKNHLILDISAEESKPKPVYQRKGILILAVIIVAILIGLASCYLIAPAILESWGFTKKGVVGDSYASQLMSEEHKNNGKISKESWVAWYQRAGMKGFDKVTKALLFFAGFFIFGSISFSVYCVWFLYNYLRQKYKKYKELVMQKLPLTEETNSIV